LHMCTLLQIVTDVHLVQETLRHVENKIMMLNHGFSLVECVYSHRFLLCAFLW